MSVPNFVRRARARRLIGHGAASLVLLGLIGLQSLTSGAPTDAHPRTGSPVLSEEDLTSEVARIEVRLADDRYSLVRSGESWHMDSALGYPVRLEQVGALLTGLSELSWGEAKTADPRKFDRIGLADPDEGGNGAELRLFDENGNRIAGLILGRRDGRLYLRNTTESLAFQAEGDLPQLQTRHGWMDFEVIAILPSAQDASRTITVRAAMPNPGLRLKPGMFAQVMLAPERREALLVPSEAVIRTGERTLAMIAQG